MSEPLVTYVEDHLAGAAYAIDLLGAIRDQHAGEPLGQFAVGMLVEVEADNGVLKALAERIGTGSSGLKGLAAWMRFEITSDDHIERITDDLETEAHEQASAFATEQELNELAGGWPMKRLIAIWNSLPGAQPVQKFENRQIALARIWRAIQPQAEPSNETAMRASHPRTAHGCRVVFREGSKAAQVCSLLSRPGGATLNEIRSATGWQAHTVRGFISRTLRKQGRKVRSFEKNGERIYRVRS